jgi:hypothetical protein
MKKLVYFTWTRTVIQRALVQTRYKRAINVNHRTAGEQFNTFIKPCIIVSDENKSQW